MLFVATWLVLEIKIVSEVNHTEKDKSHMESLYVESKRNEIIENKNRLTEIENTFLVTVRDSLGV